MSGHGKGVSFNKKYKSGPEKGGQCVSGLEQERYFSKIYKSEPELGDQLNKKYKSEPGQGNEFNKNIYRKVGKNISDEENQSIAQRI